LIVYRRYILVGITSSVYRFYNVFPRTIWSRRVSEQPDYILYGSWTIENRNLRKHLLTAQQKLKPINGIIRGREQKCIFFNYPRCQLPRRVNTIQIRISPYRFLGHGNTGHPDVKKKYVHNNTYTYVVKERKRESEKENKDGNKENRSVTIFKTL
jgi:hypothetical protein